MLFSEGSDGSTGKNRRRLIRGFAEVLQEKGYASVTVLDIVRNAAVSKRTFYEHFPDKEACLVACYLEGSAFLLNAMALSRDPKAPWQTQVQTLVASYLSALQTHPVMTRTVFIEIQAASSRILEQRRWVNQSFVEALISFSVEVTRHHPELKPLSAQAALILVGGINEMVLFAAEDKALGELSLMAAGIVEMISDLLKKHS